MRASLEEKMSLVFLIFGAAMIAGGCASMNPALIIGGGVIFITATAGFLLYN
jgi:deoxyhypusine synthase